MADLKFHEAANIFPLIEDDDFDGLVEDIRAKGQLVPIKLYKGEVIDGRNRYRACLLAGKKPETEDATAEVDRVGGPAAYVLSMDKRRHMEKSQRAMCAARLLDYEKALAKERMLKGGEKGRSLQAEHGRHGDGNKAPGPTKAVRARDMAGQKFSVTGETVDRAAKVIAKGAPEVVKAVDSGVLAVRTAARIADLPKEEQPAAVAAAIEKPRRMKEPSARMPGQNIAEEWQAVEAAVKSIRKEIKSIARVSAKYEGLGSKSKDLIREAIKELKEVL